MKNLKKMLFGLAALVLAFGLVFSVSAFTKSESTAQVSSTYFYNGPVGSALDVEDPANWSMSQNPSFTCAGETTVPCSIQVPNGKTISEHLIDLGSKNEIIDNSTLGRENQ